MQSIEIKESQKQLWNRFIAENSPESFLQTWEWGEFQRSLGRKVWRVGVIDDGKHNSGVKQYLKKQILNSKSQIPNSETKIVALALIVKHDLPFGMGYLYCPRGPVMEKSKIKNQKSKFWNILFSKIREIAKREGCFFLKMDPPVELNDESGIINREYLKGFKKSSVEIQPKNTLMLELSKSEEEILSEMKQKTRYNIRLAEKRGVDVVCYKLHMTNHKEFEKRFEEFWKLTNETSRRDSFKSHGKDHYWKMIKTLSKSADESENTLKARLYIAEYNKRIITANIVLFFGDYCVYLHGASSDADRNAMAPYLLQWTQIQDAKKMGCKKYDFWGISLDDEKQNWAGITRFKKGFGGSEKRYVGTMDLILGKTRYAIYKILRNKRYFAVK